MTDRKDTAEAKGRAAADAADAGAAARTDAAGPAGPPAGLVPPAPGDPLARVALEVLYRLEAAYGRPVLQPRREPMHELISTMLSHRTRESAEERAYAAMRERYPSWDDVRLADEGELAETLHGVTFPEPKARNIKTTLARIREERGRYDLGFLGDLPTDEATAWLTSLPGVGIKTATLVLLFCFSHPVLPVDTHVHRVTGRLGLLPPRASAARAHDLLPGILPPDARDLYSFHMGMLAHGRRTCTFRSPRCGDCVLQDLCPSAFKVG